MFERRRSGLRVCCRSLAALKQKSVVSILPCFIKICRMVSSFTINPTTYSSLAATSSSPSTPSSVASSLAGASSSFLPNSGSQLGFSKPRSLRNLGWRWVEGRPAGLVGAKARVEPAAAATRKRAERPRIFVLTAGC